MIKYAQQMRVALAVTALVLVAVQSNVQATVPAIAAPYGLSFLELKITGDEFILLQNTTAGSLDVSNYWLASYNNVNPLAGGVSSTSQQLPSVILLAGQTLLLSASPMQTCGASVAGKLSLNLTDAGGFLQLSNYALNPAGAVSQTAGDYVSWSAGANGTIQNVPSSTKAPKATYYRYSAEDGYAWQQADLNTADGCQLNIVVAGGISSSSAVTPLTLAATSPPATILGAVSDSADGTAITALPPSDIGLTAPQISELLPNPLGIGNDASDEYIELYNPNSKPFDLSGFTLQTGLTSFKSYVFPEGTTLAAGSFKAFSAADTKLSLSNTTSQAALLDPFGNVLATSDIYKNAKDGIGWDNANGKWLWSTKLTPGSANVIQQPATKKAATKAPTKKPVAASAKAFNKVSAKEAPNAGAFQSADQASVVHYRVLALVGGLALLYGLYEYRRDMANRLRQLGKKLGLGRTAGPEAEGRRSD